jgi:antitoxin ParD1/3/4
LLENFGLDSIDILWAWADDNHVNVVLTKRQKQYVAQKVQSGHYASASEVVREALRVLEDLECDRSHLEALLDEADLEPALPGGPAFWKKLRADLRAEGRKRRAA